MANVENEDYFDGLVFDPQNNPYLHTPEFPFCANPTCPCHEEDEDQIHSLNEHVMNGLATPEDASRIHQRKVV
jgi:hypothetical protein